MDKKQLIMEKALALFAKEGYEGCGVMRIVTESQVTKPTLYHYFGSKEGVLRSIYETYFTGFLQTLDKDIQYQENMMACVGKIIRLYTDFALRNPDFYWLTAHLRKGPKESESYLIVAKYHTREREILRNFMEEVSLVHVNLKGMEEQLTRNLLSLISGLIEDRILSEKNQKVEENDIILLTKQYLYGIFSL